MPRRTCLGCRRVFEKAALVRFVSSGGVLKADLKGTSPGRGAYICPVRGCVEAAMKRKELFSRALRTKVSLPEVEGVERLIDAIRGDKGR